MYMKGVVRMDAMKYNHTQFLREIQKRYAELMRQSAESTSCSGEPLSSAELNQFCAQLDDLILGMATCKNLDKENFKLLDIDWKFNVLQRLLRKMRGLPKLTLGWRRDMPAQGVPSRR